MNAENKMVVFKKSHNGFDKNDVMRYIEDMNRRFRETTDSLQRENEDLKRQSSNEDSEEAAEMQRQIRLLTEENNALRAELESYKNNSIKSENSDNEESTQAQKSVSEKIGDLLLFAQSEADKLLEQANDEVRKMQDSSQADADRIRDDAAVISRAMVEETRESLNQLTESFLKSISSYTHGMVNECEESLSGLRTRLRDVQYKAGESAAKADKEIQELISSAFPASNRES